MKEYNTDFVDIELWDCYTEICNGFYKQDSSKPLNDLIIILNNKNKDFIIRNSLMVSRFEYYIDFIQYNYKVFSIRVNYLDTKESHYNIYKYEDINLMLQETYLKYYKIPYHKTKIEVKPKKYIKLDI